MAQVRVSFCDLKSRFGFSLHYAVLNSEKIYNIYGPCAPRRPIKVWSKQYRKDLRRRELKFVQKRNKIDDFYNKLELSIIKNGFFNPILVYSGKKPTQNAVLPPEMLQNSKEILVCVFGGSRLWVAQKQKRPLLIPCVICDWFGKFSKCRELHSESEFLSLFKSKVDFSINKNGIRIKNLKD